MKKFSAIGTLFLVLSLGTAFSEVVNKVGFNLSATGQLPVGGFTDDGPGVGLGGLAGIEAGMYPGFAITARSGYLYHFEENNISYYHQIPVMGGAKLTIPVTPLYVAGELGAVFVRSHRTANGVNLDHQNSDTFFGWDAGLGSMVGPADVRVTLNFLDASDMANSMTIGLSVGFTVFNM